MVKFGKYLENHAIAEWSTQYVRYKRLKKLLKQVELEHAERAAKEAVMPPTTTTAAAATTATSPSRGDSPSRTPQLRLSAEQQKTLASLRAQQKAQKAHETSAVAAATRPATAGAELRTGQQWIARTRASVINTERWLTQQRNNEAEVRMARRLGRLPVAAESSELPNAAMDATAASSAAIASPTMPTPAPIASADPNRLAYATLSEATLSDARLPEKDSDGARALDTVLLEGHTHPTDAATVSEDREVRKLSQYIPVAVRATFTRAERSFFRLLEEDVITINSFFLKQEDFFLDKLNVLVEQLERLTREEEASTNQRASAHHASVKERAMWLMATAQRREQTGPDGDRDDNQLDPLNAPPSNEPLVQTELHSIPQQVDGARSARPSARSSRRASKAPSRSRSRSLFAPVLFHEHRPPYSQLRADPASGSRPFPLPAAPPPPPMIPSPAADPPFPPTVAAPPSSSSPPPPLRRQYSSSSADEADDDDATQDGNDEDDAGSSREASPSQRARRWKVEKPDPIPIASDLAPQRALGASDDPSPSSDADSGLFGSRATSTITQHPHLQLKFRLLTAAKPWRVLQKALSELYRGLQLLRNYKILNFTAFVKILKKYDKISARARGDQFSQLFHAGRLLLPRIQSTHFLASPILKAFLRRVELIFASTFTSGDHTRALETLRVVAPPITSETWFRLGGLLGCSAILGLLMVGLVAWIVTQHIELPFSATISVWRGLALLLAHGWGWSMITYLCHRYRINTELILDIDPRSELKFEQMLIAAASLSVLWLLLLDLYIGLGLIKHSGHMWTEAVSGWIPFTLFVVFFLICFIPFDLFFHSTRVYIFRTLCKIVTTPFHRVAFKDFFLADQLNSLTNIMNDIAYSFCYFGTGHFLNDSPTETQCIDIRTYKTAWIFLASPPWFRLWQCLRRIYSEPVVRRQQSINAGKYVFNCLTNIFNLLNKQYPNTAFFHLWIAIAVVNTVYSFSWDVIFDWGLVSFGRKDWWRPRFLRRKLVLKNHLPYYFAIVSNLAFRVAWILTIEPAIWGIHVQSDVWNSMLYTLEIIRRNQWNFYRLENEHLTNCENFRVVNIVPLRMDQEPTKFRAEEDVRDQDKERAKSRRASKNLRGTSADGGEVDTRSRLLSANAGEGSLHASASVHSVHGLTAPDALDQDPDRHDDPDLHELTFRGAASPPLDRVPDRYDQDNEPEQFEVDPAIEFHLSPSASASNLNEFATRSPTPERRQSQFAQADEVRLQLESDVSSSPEVQAVASSVGNLASSRTMPHLSHSATVELHRQLATIRDDGTWPPPRFPTAAAQLYLYGLGGSHRVLPSHELASAPATSRRSAGESPQPAAAAAAAAAAAHAHAQSQEVSPNSPGSVMRRARRISLSRDSDAIGQADEEDDMRTNRFDLARGAHNANGIASSPSPDPLQASSARLPQPPLVDLRVPALRARTESEVDDLFDHILARRKSMSVLSLNQLQLTPPPESPRNSRPTRTRATVHNQRRTAGATAMQTAGHSPTRGGFSQLPPMHPPAPDSRRPSLLALDAAAAAAATAASEPATAAATLTPPRVVALPLRRTPSPPSTRHLVVAVGPPGPSSIAIPHSPKPASAPGLMSEEFEV